MQQFGSEHQNSLRNAGINDRRELSIMKHELSPLYVKENKLERLKIRLKKLEIAIITRLIA